MACNIITQFRTKPGRADDLIALLNKYIAGGASHAGCVEISIQQNQDDPNDIISNQRWETRKHYEDYFAWRAEQGVAAETQALCAEPVSARYFDEVLEATAPAKSASSPSAAPSPPPPTASTTKCSNPPNSTRSRNSPSSSSATPTAPRRKK